MSRLLDAAKGYEREAYGGIYTVNADPAGAGAQITKEFARSGLEHRDSRDELMRQKMEFIAQNAGPNTPFGVVQASAEDFNWLQKKRETEAAANLDKWIADEFNSGDVARRKWLQEVFPEFFEVRERQLLDRAKFATRVNLLLLRGPKNEKDLILLWGLQTGQIKLDADWNRIGPVGATKNAGDDPSTRFKQGLMDFRRYKTDTERSAAITNANNPFGQNPATAGTNQVAAPFSTGAAVDNPRYTGFLAALGI